MNTWIGRRIGAHSTGLGKALLAYLTKERFEELFKSKSLAHPTPKTICSKDALRREMQKIQILGYAIDDEECGTGVRCVGAAIFDREGKPIAAIGVSGTTAQVPRHRLESLGTLAHDHTRKISRNLGFNP